jgi:hypothetical protein
MPDILTDRLIEYLTGVKLRSEEERLEHLQSLQDFLRSDYPGGIISGELPNPDLPGRDEPPSAERQ